MAKPPKVDWHVSVSLRQPPEVLCVQLCIKKWLPSSPPPSEGRNACSMLPPLFPVWENTTLTSLCSAAELPSGTEQRRHNIKVSKGKREDSVPAPLSRKVIAGCGGFSEKCLP